MSMTAVPSRRFRPPLPLSALRSLLPLLLLATVPGASRTGADTTVRVLVRFTPGVVMEERELVARRLHGGVRRAFASAPLAALELPASEIDALRRDPRVATVEADPVYHAAALALSELKPTIDNGLYGLVLSRAVQAQARKVTGKGVRVCIADTGIDAHHSDLSRAYAGGFDLVDDDENPDVGSDLGLGEHATMVAGILAAAVNRKGVHGVAYDAQLRVARVLGADGTGFGSDVMAAVERLVEEDGCRVVNLSLGTSERTDSEELFYRDLLARNDVLLVAAAGNDGHAGVSYPAAYPGVVAVGAVDHTAALASFSNTGPEIDLVAPGVGILSSVPRGSGSEAYVSAGHVWPASAFTYAGQTRRSGIRAALVDCGSGNTAEEFPRKVRGGIALMRRGDAFFSVKVENAMNAGARAALIYNNVAEGVIGTLQEPTASDGRPWIPAVLVSEADGAYLRAHRKAIALVNGPSDWDAGSGTSFAAPHVAGAAALVWSVDRTLSRDQVLSLLETTAVDLGEAGPDERFGWGLIDADASSRAAR